MSRSIPWSVLTSGQQYLNCLHSIQIPPTVINSQSHFRHFSRFTTAARKHQPNIHSFRHKFQYYSVFSICVVMQSQEWASRVPLPRPYIPQLRHYCSSNQSNGAYMAVVTGKFKIMYWEICRGPGGGEFPLPINSLHGHPPRRLGLQNTCLPARNAYLLRHWFKHLKYNNVLEPI